MRITLIHLDTTATPCDDRRVGTLHKSRLFVRPDFSRQANMSPAAFFSGCRRYFEQMRSAIHAFFAILAAIGTMVSVFAVKQGILWELQGASDSKLNVLLVAVFGPLLLCAVWLWLLRPMIERRKQAKDAGLREHPVRDTAGD